MKWLSHGDRASGDFYFLFLSSVCKYTCNAWRVTGWKNKRCVRIVLSFWCSSFVWTVTAYLSSPMVCLWRSQDNDSLLPHLCSGLQTPVIRLGSELLHRLNHQEAHSQHLWCDVDTAGLATLFWALMLRCDLKRLFIAFFTSFSEPTWSYSPMQMPKHCSLTHSHLGARASSFQNILHHNPISLQPSCLAYWWPQSRLIINVPSVSIFTVLYFWSCLNSL